MNFNSFYEHNVLSNQIIGGEFQIMFPIKRSGLIKAEINAEVANISHIERQMKIMQQHQYYKRQQLKKEIDVLNQQLTLTHRRRQLADQKWQLNKKSFTTATLFLISKLKKPIVPISPNLSFKSQQIK